MSGNGAAVVGEVYRILQDDAADPVVPEDAIRQAVGRWVNAIAGPAPPFGLNIGPFWVSTLIALQPNVRDYALTTSVGGQTNVEYQRLLDLIYQNVKLPLRRISREEGHAGRALGVTASGRQASYWVEVGPDQSINVKFPGYPINAENLDGLVSIIPSTWPQGSATPPTIPFSQTALRALELLVAAAVGQTLNVEKLSALRLSPSTLPIWVKEATELLRQERFTVMGLKRTRGPRNIEWVAGWVL